MSTYTPPPVPTVPTVGWTGVSIIGLLAGGRQALKGIISPFQDCDSLICVLETLMAMEEVVFNGVLTCVGLLVLPIGVLIWSARRAWKRQRANPQRPQSEPPVGGF